MFAKLKQQLHVKRRRRRSFIPNLRVNPLLQNEQPGSRIDAGKHALAVSVTRCWGKKLPKCLHKLPKNIHSSFSLIYLFQNSRKVNDLCGLLFVRKFVAKNFQKSPNLVTLSLLLLTTPYLLLMLRVWPEHRYLINGYTRPKVNNTNAFHNIRQLLLETIIF